MFKNMSKNLNKGQKMVLRFAKGPRLAHWTYAFSFLILFITGAPKMFKWEGLNFIYSVFGGPATTMIIHRIFACILASTLVLMLLFDRKNLWKWVRELFDWKKRDRDFLKVFPKEFFGLHAKYPPQGFLNGGTKINSILQIVCGFFMVLSGVFMWFPNVLSQGIQTWMYPMHTIFVCIATAVVFGHIFLAVLHPNAKGGLQGMVNGYVPESYAKEHHGAWLEEVKAENAKLPADKKEIVSYEEYVEKKVSS